MNFYVESQSNAVIAFPAMIIVSIAVPDLQSAEAQIAASAGAGGVELRLDLFEKGSLAQIERLIKKSAVPVLLTVRRRDQGGAFLGSEEERLHLIESLCTLQLAYVDLEWDVPSSLRQRLYARFPKIVFLSSYHNFEKMPPLETLFAQMQTPYAQIYKIAVTGSGVLDALEMLRFVARKKQEGVRIIGISMGRGGEITRILSPVFGGAMTFAASSAEARTAPGQLTLKELIETYRYPLLNAQTALYGLIGDPVDKSVGHQVHNAVINELGLSAVYVKMVVKKEELDPFFSLVRKMPFHGLSVTMPLKEAVLAYVDRKSGDVEQIGACNTVLLKEGQLCGYNTDGRGALDALEAKSLVQGKKVLILGAGGAAKAIAFEAIKRGARVCILNRTEATARALAQQFGCAGEGIDQMAKHFEEGYDVLINTTPEAHPIEPRFIRPKGLVMDCVYVPKHTPFLLEARARGCSLVFGEEMFLNQAALQWEIWQEGRIDTVRVKKIIQSVF